MRPLARVYVDALHQAGHQCRLITSDQHYEPVPARDYERVLDPRPRDPRTLPPLLRVLADARRWRPDVVITELVWDPRWLPLTRLAPMVHLVHDDQPHDATEIRPAWQRALFRHLCRAATELVAFSEHVARRLDATVVPLTSDVADTDLPTITGPRRDFVLYGRIAPYKNVPVALRAWRRHLDSPAYAGDRLLIIGDGPADLGALPPHCEWRRGRFRYPDVLPVLGAAKGSLAHYRLATQSGVQLLSMQLGVTPIVSDSGGLPEFQPPGEQGVGVDDVTGLAAAFDALADPEAAEKRGAAAREHYLRWFAASRSAAALADILAQVS
ncbi:MAG TPA: glycosyltransferase [Pseudonocardiaceae bacterium]|jgi:glycosyltransferase involved in cell wall biosynthesis|nr:glycosyltransferase [Pseudonocardiaceae bacterium]